MFRLDEERVVDATLSGGLARYINHSCNPNCVTEIVEVDREFRIIIFAKRRINRGEEVSGKVLLLVLAALRGSHVGEVDGIIIIMKLFLYVSYLLLNSCPTITSSTLRTTPTRSLACAERPTARSG